MFAFFGPEMAPNDWGMLIGFMAILAMLIGNIVAIRQSNIKRMLAYSSIAQAGYVMIGMISLNEHGLASVGYFMLAYMFANMGAFAMVSIFEDKSGSCQISSYAGLSKTSPLFSASLSSFNNEHLSYGFILPTFPIFNQVIDPCWCDKAIMQVFIIERQ